jgi:aspartate racemase
MSEDLIPDELILGVLGGMGPRAGIDFLSKLTAATPVTCEQDHLHVLLDSNPKVPDRNHAIARGRAGHLPDSRRLGLVLAAMARTLDLAGATLLVMACNTAHAFEDDVRAVTRLPFVSIIDEACDAICLREVPDAKRVGILATQGCIDANLYQQALIRRGREPLLLTAQFQEHFMRLIYQIKIGNLTNELATEMVSIAQALIDSGADAIVAGCTEVPLVLRPGTLSCPLIDATENLARRCVRYARHLDPLPQYCFSH